MLLGNQQLGTTKCYDNASTNSTSTKPQINMASRRKLHRVISHG